MKLTTKHEPLALTFGMTVQGFHRNVTCSGQEASVSKGCCLNADGRASEYRVWRMTTDRKSNVKTKIATVTFHRCTLHKLRSSRNATTCLCVKYMQVRTQDWSSMQ